MSDNIGIKLTNAQRRALLKKDIKRESSVELAFWTDYYEKQAKERNKSSIISFATGIIGGIAGFMTGGVPGMKAGYSWGSTVGKAGRLMDKGRFDEVKFLRDNKLPVMGKFNLTEDKINYEKALRTAEDNELALKLDLGLDIFKATYATGTAKAQDVHGLSRKEWRDTTWWKRPGIAFKDMAKSDLQKAMEILDAAKEPDTDLTSIFDQFPTEDTTPFEVTESEEWGFIPFAGNDLGSYTREGLNNAFGDILSQDTINIIAADNPGELIKKLDTGIKDNNLEEVLSNEFKIDLDEIQNKDFIEPVDTLNVGGGLIEEDYLGEKEIEKRLNVFTAGLIKPPALDPTEEVVDSLMDEPLDFGSVDMLNNSLEELDPFVMPDPVDIPAPLDLTNATQYSTQHMDTLKYSLEIEKALDYIDTYGIPSRETRFPLFIDKDIFKYAVENYNKTLQGDN